MLDTERYWQEEWAARVLRWARGKTRTAQEAEDLAQTVLLEWLRAVRAQEERGVCVAEPEHLLWRIARFVWCKSLRPGTYYRCEPLSEKLSAGETPEESAERQDEQRRQTAFVPANHAPKPHPAGNACLVLSGEPNDGRHCPALAGLGEHRSLASE